MSPNGNLPIFQLIVAGGGGKPQPPTSGKISAIFSQPQVRSVDYLPKPPLCLCPSNSRSKKNHAGQSCDPATVLMIPIADRQERDCPDTQERLLIDDDNTLRGIGFSDTLHHNLASVSKLNQRSPR